jgi:hypothetical protein
MAGTKTGGAGEQDFHCLASKVASILAPDGLRLEHGNRHAPLSLARVAFVIPAYAGIQLKIQLDPGLRRGDATGRGY